MNKDDKNSIPFGKQETKQNVSDENRQKARHAMNAMSETLFMLGQEFLKDEDYEQAFKQFKLIAENDEYHVDSQFNLAVMCQRGMGTEKNIHEAIRWYETAANNGDERAMYNLGAIYYDGEEGLEPDKERYFHWMRMAAQKGNDRAKLSINQCFTKVIQDIITELNLSPQWITDEHSFRVHIPNPKKPNNDLGGTIKVDKDILFLSIYPFDPVSDNFKQRIEPIFAAVNKKTRVTQFGINDNNQIYAMSVMEMDKMLTEADDFEEATQMLHLYIDHAASESMWMYNQLLKASNH